MTEDKCKRTHKHKHTQNEGHRKGMNSWINQKKNLVISQE